LTRSRNAIVAEERRIPVYEPRLARTGAPGSGSFADELDLIEKGEAA
jgi:hypothetical protein